MVHAPFNKRGKKEKKKKENLKMENEQGHMHNDCPGKVAPIVGERSIASLAALSGCDLGHEVVRVGVGAEEHGIDLRWMADVVSEAPRLTTIELLRSEKSLTNTPCVINSPRSAYLLLKNGLRITDLLCDDPLTIYAKAKLEGLSTDAQQLRYEAEKDRCAHRLTVLCDEYSLLCGAVAREEVVESVRAFINKASALKMSEKQKKTRVEISESGTTPPIRLNSKESDVVECADVLEAAREQSRSFARRVLRQKELKAQQQAAREHEVYCSEGKSMERSRRLDEKSRTQQTQRLAILEEKNSFFRQRIADIRAQEKQNVLEKAKLIDERDTSVFRRLEAIKSLRTESLQTKKEDKRAHRETVRRKDAELQQQRHHQLVESSKDASFSHESTVRRQREEASLRKEQKQSLTDSQKEAVKEAQLYQSERLEARRRALEHEANMRHEAFQHRREQRLNAQRELYDTRAQRSRFSRGMSESKFKANLEAIDEYRRERIGAVEEICAEKKNTMALQTEALRQMRSSKREEQQRLERASAFALLGCVSDSAAKDLVIKHERARRVELSHIVRTERDALARALGREVKVIEAEGIVRAKDECSRLHKS